MKSTTEDDETRTEWKLLKPRQNNGIGWKLTHTNGSDRVRMEEYSSPECDAEFTIPLHHIDQFVSGLQEAYWDSIEDEWTKRDWRFPIGEDELLIASPHDESVVEVLNHDTTERVSFEPSAFDMMFPGFNEARYDLTEEVDTGDGEFQILYQEGERDHILRNGVQVCPCEATLGKHPETKRIEALSDHEVSLLSNDAMNFCGYCQRFLKKNALLDGTDPGTLPSFECPECGEDAMVVQQLDTSGEVEHEDGTTHEFDFSVYEQWRRGNDSKQMTQ